MFNVYVVVIEYFTLFKKFHFDISKLIIVIDKYLINLYCVAIFYQGININILTILAVTIVVAILSNNCCHCYDKLDLVLMIYYK